MSSRDGFSLRQVTLTRNGAKGYGFGIRKYVLRAPPNAGSHLEHLTTYFIGDIIAASSAEAANMQTGDRIVSINGLAVTGQPNTRVVDVVKASSTLNLLLVPQTDQTPSMFQKHQSRVKSSSTYHLPSQSLGRYYSGSQRRLHAASYSRLHSITEHGELACQRRPRSMVYPARIMSDACLHSMDSIPRKASVDSLESIESLTNKSAAESTSCSNSGLVDIPQTEVSAKVIQTSVQTSKAQSSSCLLEPTGYTTSAKLQDHFPQKLLRPSSTDYIRSSRNSLGTNSDHRASSHSISSKQPTGTKSSLTSPSDQTDNKSITGSETAPSTQAQAKSDEQKSGIRFLPAYRDKTVEEMMHHQSPKATWQHNTKYGPGTLSRNESALQRQRGQSARYAAYEAAPQQGRQYTAPTASIPRNAPVRYYPPAIAQRPPEMMRRVSDGTHPRMSPMRATAPQTYHGRPIHHNSHEPIQSNTNRRAPVPQERNSYRPPQIQQGDTRVRGRADLRQQSRSNNDIRTANSENNLNRQPAQPVPSGKYHASSSMTSIPQFAHLVTHQPHRADSTGNMKSLEARHSYSFQQLSQPCQQTATPTRSYESLHETPATGRNQSAYPHSSPNVNRLSYAHAVHPTQRSGVHSISEEPITLSRTSSEGSESPIIYRDKPPIENDPSAKILRRTSYLMATSRPEFPSTPEESRMNSKPTNIRKLKSFFGEKTPSIKEAQEKATSQSDVTYSLPDNLEVHKVGILAVKVVAVDSKKATDRSWKAMGAALCGHMLYLLKDKKEHANMLTTTSGSFIIDDKPISIRACHVDIAHGYTKKRHVFKLITYSHSEYMLQADDHHDMMSWIKAIMANSNPDAESEKLSSTELVKRITTQQSKLSQQKKRITNLSFKNKTASPSAKSDSGTQKRDKKRTPPAVKSLEFGYQEPCGDFGIPLSECTPSHENEFVPLVVELCTRAIETHGLDTTGIYRVPGNKAAINALKEELKKGIIDLENDKWRDMNVLSSLLKSFFQRLPDSLITTEKYKTFIETNRITDSQTRLTSLKKLIRTLPEVNFETLKFLSCHLRKVSEHGNENKMDTRNLAIVFGPTIIKSGEDVMSMVTDMSDQCRIIESMILYCDWMFAYDDTPPPSVQDTETATVAPISETMNNMSADLAQLASSGKKQSKSQLMSAFNSAVNKNISKVSLGGPSTSSPVRDTQPPVTPTSTDEFGFENRNLMKEAAVRNLKLREQKSRESRESLNKVQASMVSNEMDTADERYPHLRSDINPHHKWHSEESVLLQHDKHRRHPSNTSHLQTTDWQGRESPAPPLPARGGQELKPPLPPKPMQLCYARPTQISMTGNTPISPDDDGSVQHYVNVDDLTGNIQSPKSPLPYIPQYQRTISAVHHPLVRSTNLPRRGSLDSMMDTYETFQYSSTDSEDGADLLSSITATFDEKLKLLVNPKYQHGQNVRRPKTNSDSSSVESSLVGLVNLTNSLSSSNPYRGSTDRSRESLLSVLSNKENINLLETSSGFGPESSDRGFDGSNSSLGSGQPNREAKVGIASRIERNDIKPIGSAPIPRCSQTKVVNATGSVLQRTSTSDVSSDDEKDCVNNNTLHSGYVDEDSFIHRRMSDEKKKIRRRHTVGGAKHFDVLKDMLAGKQNILSEAHIPNMPEQQTLSAWQRLQPRDTKEPLSLKDWLERERFRASSPELELHTTPNIMHLQRVGRKLASSVLQTNT